METRQFINKDTQIFKEYRGGKCKISEAEWNIIYSSARMGIWADGYRYNDDKDNGYIAFSFGKVGQKDNPAWGEELVEKLNKASRSTDWHIGDADTEYVFNID